MKKHYIITACMTLMSFCATSCLDFNPQANMGDDLVWSKTENYQLFANQFYGWTRSFTNHGIHDDYRSDLIATSSINTYSQGTNTIPSTDGTFKDLYKHIYYTNLLLKNAEMFGNSGAIAVPIAEAKFFRAYSHFELVQMYGDAILLTTPLDLDSEQLYGKRDDRGVVIDQVIKDLQEAADGLPETETEAGRLNKYAAWAMLSRVALYEGTWQKFHTAGSDATSNTSRSTALLTIAKNAAAKVIESSKYKLFYNNILGKDSYRYMFILEDAAQCNPANIGKSANTEYILSHRFRSEDGCGTNLTHGYLANVCFITRKLANLYLCSDGLPIEKSTKFKGYDTDISEFQNRDNRMTTTLLQNGEKYWNNDGKWRTSWNEQDLEDGRCLILNARSNSGYQNHKWAVEREVADTKESPDYPVIRYAEVLLNYAEAAYELDGEISDNDLDISLNLVRQRINPDMPKLTNAFVAANNLSMREEIRRERSLELILEGFRIDDLKRWATAVAEMSQDQLGVKVKGTWFETNWTGQSRQLNSDGCIILYDGRKWTDKNYLYPLPSDQIQLNPNLGQNPGWTNK